MCILCIIMDIILDENLKRGIKMRNIIVQFLIASFVVLSVNFTNNDLNTIHHYEDSLETISYTREPIVLSWDKLPEKSNKGEKININFSSDLNQSLSLDKNVAYVFQCSKNNQCISEEDVTVIYKGNRIHGDNGKYIIEKEDEINSNKNYSFQVIFNTKGKYDIKLYVEEC